MPTFDQYPSVSSLNATDIFVLDRNGVGTVSIEAVNFVSSAVFVFPNFATAPSSPVVGQAYFDTVLGYPRIYGSDLIWHGFLLS